MAVEEEREIFGFLGDLVKATAAGEVNWEQTGPETFEVDTSSGGIRVQSLSEQDHPFVVQIFDEEGRLIYELRTEVAPFYNEPEVLAASLFAAARSSIYDVGGTIQRIRHNLGL